jgi:hypothetical protein
MFKNLPVEIEAVESTSDELFTQVDSTDSDNLDQLEQELFISKNDDE